MSERDIPDVCIIGAGLAGGLVAHELSRRGLKVVVVEAGSRHDPNQRYLSLQRRLLDGVPPWQADPERDVYTNAGAFEYPLNSFRVKGVGGTTLHWTALTWRLHESDFAMRTRYGIADDWPLSYDELEPYYAQAELALGVSGAADNPFASYRSNDYPLPPFPYSYSDEIMRRACDQVGIAVHHAAYARSSIPHRKRPACQAFGTCGAYQICPIVAQYTAETHVALAETDGNATVIPDATVLRLNVDRSRKVESVTYARADKTQAEQPARLFVLAAHAVESARLLLLSESSQFPHGLANNSGMVGKHFMEHPFVYANGVMKEPMFPYRIGFHTMETHQFAVSDQRDEQAAFKMSFLNHAGPVPADIARDSGNWGDALAQEIRESFGRQVGIHAYLEQLPDPKNTITLDPVVVDCFGNPAPRLTYSVGSYEHAARRRAIRVLQQILDAAGAAHIISSFDGEYLMCGHHIGTCRMGNDPDTSVVDHNLRAHDVDNLFLVGSSVFVTAGPYNPSLTIAALALRAAQHIAAA